MHLKKYQSFLFGLFAFLLQLSFTLTSFNQIRLEEIADSIRSPYYLSQGELYDGVYSNIAWYSLLLLLYQIFGFHLFLAKIFRLFLFSASVFFLSKLLFKYLKKTALIPLITIILSPTFLYLNSIETINGLIIQYLPIILYLLDNLDFQYNLKNYLNHFLFFFFLMFSWMTYSLFIVYLPIFIILYLNKFKSSQFNQKFNLLNTQIIFSLIGFFSPFLLILLLKNKLELFFDPKVSKGIFRGAGEIKISLEIISQNLSGLFKDLFLRGQSYLFEIKLPEFSLIFPILSVILVFYLSQKMIKKPKYQLYIKLSFLLIILNLILSSLSFDPSFQPGIRRNTALLAAYYFLFILSFSFTVSSKIKYRKAFIAIFLLLPIHHLIVYPFNLRNLSEKSSYIASTWFEYEKIPQKTLEKYLEIVKSQDLYLSCQNEKGEIFECRYPEIYSTIEAACLFNKLNCHNIYGYSSKTNQYQLLTPNLWQQ